MPFALIPFALLVIPILEIAVFILVGNLIGLWPTLGLVIVTAIGGSFLLKQQGLGTLSRIQSQMRTGQMPARELVDGVMIAVAGVLLLTPGLVTDAFGFLLFVPPFRSAVWRYLKSRVVVVAGQGLGQRGGPPPRGNPFRGSSSRGFPDDASARRQAGGPDVVDLSGDEYKREPDPSSPWHEGDARRENGADPAKPNGRTLH